MGLKQFFLMKKMLDFKIYLCYCVLIKKRNGRTMFKHFEISGRSMVEMIGVLSVVGFLTYGGIIGYLQASQRLRLNNLKDEISTLVANIRSLYFKFPSYEGISEVTLISSGFVPERMISKDRKSIINSLRGSVYVGSGGGALDKNGAFILIYNGLDSTSCHNLIAENWGSDLSSGFLGITISSNGDLTVETSNLTSATITSNETTFSSIELPKVLLNDKYDLCNCGNLNTCAIAWKFL